VILASVQLASKATGRRASTASERPRIVRSRDGDHVLVLIAALTLITAGRPPRCSLSVLLFRQKAQEEENARAAAAKSDPRTMAVFSFLLFYGVFFPID